MHGHNICLIGVSMIERSLFRAVVTQRYLLILQDIAPKTSLILSSLLEPKWSQSVQIRACRDLPQIERLRERSQMCVAIRATPTAGPCGRNDLRKFLPSSSTKSDEAHRVVNVNNCARY